MTVGEAYKKIEKIKPLEAAQIAFEKTADEYAKLNAEQMFDGFNSKDQLIRLNGRGYAAQTIAAKSRKGQPTDRVTLRDTGKFQSGLYARMEGRYIKTGSVDSKSDWLEHRSGKDIFGLGPDSKKLFATTTFFNAFMAELKLDLQ